MTTISIIIDSAGNIYAYSDNTQNGSQDPYEEIDTRY